MAREGLGFRGSGFTGLGFRGLGFRGLGFRGLGLSSQPSFGLVRSDCWMERRAPEFIP